MGLGFHPDFVIMHQKGRLFCAQCLPILIFFFTWLHCPIETFQYENSSLQKQSENENSAAHARAKHTRVSIFKISELVDCPMGVVLPLFLATSEVIASLNSLSRSLLFCGVGGADLAECMLGTCLARKLANSTWIFFQRLHIVLMYLRLRSFWMLCHLVTPFIRRTNFHLKRNYRCGLHAFPHIEMQLTPCLFKSFSSSAV